MEIVLGGEGFAYDYEVLIWEASQDFVPGRVRWEKFQAAVSSHDLDIACAQHRPAASDAELHAVEDVDRFYACDGGHLFRQIGRERRKLACSCPTGGANIEVGSQLLVEPDYYRLAETGDH